MLYLNGVLADIMQFPNGESFLDIDPSCVNQDENSIQIRFESDKDLMGLKYLKDFVDSFGYGCKVKLKMPYIPYSRMDRQEQTRLFTLKSVAGFINALHFNEVEVYEPHSDVSVALLNNVVVKNKSIDLALDALMSVLNLTGSVWKSSHSEPVFSEPSEGVSDYSLEGLISRAVDAGIYLVYPDAGAEKRYQKQLKYPKVLTCRKERDFKTGNIKSVVLTGDVGVTDCKVAVIVDDLCSKGGSFIGAADVLRERFPEIEQVILCVTHCENTIFSGSVLSGTEIDKVYTTDSILVKHFGKCFGESFEKLVVQTLT